MKKTTAILLAFSALLFGVVCGFLISPIKKGIEVGNNSGNSTTYLAPEKKQEEALEIE